MEGLPLLSVINWGLAFLPILTVLVLMMAFRWSGGKAGALSCFIAAIVAILIFGANIKTVAMGVTKGLWTTVFVLYIIWGAMVLYQVVYVSGGFKVIGDTFTRLTRGNPGIKLLTLGFAFPSFVQGVCGFGAPVAIAAPLLVGIGFDPIVAAAAALIGHAWSVTFGSLGSSYSVLITQTLAIDVPEVAYQVAVFAVIPIAIAGFLTPWALIHMYGGVRALRENWLGILIMGTSIAIVSIIMVLFITPYVASFTAGLVTILVGGLVLPRLTFYKQEAGVPANIPGESPIRKGDKKKISFNVAFSGYYALILVVFGIYLTPLKPLLNKYLRVGLPTITTTTSFGYTVEGEAAYSSFKFLTSPGTLIFVAAFLAYLVYKFKGLWPPDGWKRLVYGAFQQAIGATITVMTMSMMAGVMLQTGMTSLLAFGTAKFTGNAFPIFSSFIGELGAFMTGSNTNSNILFTMFQYDVARFLGISIPIILGLQTTGGAVGNMISPMNVALGSGSTNTVGREGEIMNKTLWYALIICLIVGIAGWFMQFVIFPGFKWLLPLP
jgi:lactate permease